MYPFYGATSSAFTWIKTTFLVSLVFSSDLKRRPDWMGKGVAGLEWCHWFAHQTETCSRCWLSIWSVILLTLDACTFELNSFFEGRGWFISSCCFLWLQQTLGTRTLQHPQGQWWICYRLASLVMVFMVVPLLYKISLQAIWRFPRIPRFFVRLCCGMVPFVDHVLSSWMMFDRNNLKGFNEFNGDQAFWCIYSLQCM